MTCIVTMIDERNFCDHRRRARAHVRVCEQFLYKSCEMALPTKHVAHSTKRLKSSKIVDYKRNREGKHFTRQLVFAWRR